MVLQARSSDIALYDFVSQPICSAQALGDFSLIEVAHVRTRIADAPWTKVNLEGKGALEIARIRIWLTRFRINDARDEVLGGVENHWRYTVTVDRLPLRHIGRGGHFSAGRRCYRVVYLLVRVRGHICLGP